MEITEAAFHRPSRASRTVFGDALAPLFSGLQRLKLLAELFSKAGLLAPRNEFRLGIVGLLIEVTVGANATRRSV